MSNEKKIRGLTRDEEIYISQLLKDLGVPQHILGYDYIKTAIALIRSNRDYLRNITKMLYPDIANRHNTTASRVERAIRHAIEVSWNRGDLRIMEDIFGHSVDVDKTKPTNSEFIVTIADKLKIEFDKIGAR